MKVSSHSAGDHGVDFFQAPNISNLVEVNPPKTRLFPQRHGVRRTSPQKKHNSAFHLQRFPFLMVSGRSLRKRRIKKGNGSLAGGFKYFVFSSLPREMIQFDEHIFPMGWFNHQLVPDLVVKLVFPWYCAHCNLCFKHIF